MKKFQLLILAFSIVSISNAQKMASKNIPSSVLIAFQKQFPNVKGEQWEKEGVNFEVEFEMNKQETSAVFDPTGNLLETEVEITVAELHTGIIEYINQHYSGFKVKEAAKITYADGTFSYEAEIKGMDLLFDSNGIFLKEMKD